MTRHSDRRAASRRWAGKFATLAVAGLTLAGCVGWPASGNNGIIYANVSKPIAVLEKEALATRTGEACSSGVLGLYSAGNSSVSRAKSNAGITEIHTVEERFTHYLLGLYSEYCTVVRGL